jgi:carotenoid 1,2-hydratase
MSPAFDHPVPDGGYAWWYMDALSDDGCHGITVIAFIGSVFSPYYAQARRRAQAVDPLNHCALNVALYRRAGARAPSAWTMTERGSARVQRDPMRLQIGPSAMQWQRDSLHVTIDEITAPWPSRVRGTLRLDARFLPPQAYPLDAGAQHHWCPIAPAARVELHLQQPALHWQGSGYLDANVGRRPLEQDFLRWDWSRSALAGGRSAVLYDVTRRDGSDASLALEFDPDGTARRFVPAPRQALPASHWRVARGTRGEPHRPAAVLQTLEDGPFYVRSLLRSQVLGQSVLAMHESLSLQRFSAGWVQMMLPFRMPRRAH